MPFVERFEPRVLTRDWGTETIVAHTDEYLGKVLRMNAGTKGGLQYHVEKVETFHLLSGQAWVRSVAPGTQALQSVLMTAGESYHVPSGAVHQVEAITPCVFFEASTPIFDDRVRVEEQFGLPGDGGLPTTRCESK